MGKRRNDDAGAGDGAVLPGLYRYTRWKALAKAARPDPRVWLTEGDTRDRLIAQDRAWCADPLWRRRKVGPTVDVLRLELNEPICILRRSVDVQPPHPNETPGDRISWPKAADFVREMRSQGVAWFELWPTDRLIPIVDDAVDPWTYWGEDQRPDRRFPFPP